MAFEGRTPIDVTLPDDTEEPEEPALPPPVSPAAAPTVTSVGSYNAGVYTGPATGPAAGGQRVQINGTNFSASDLTVRFGTADCTDIVRVSASAIRCTTPARAAGAVRVMVRNSDGQIGYRDSAYTYNSNLYLLPLITPTIAETNDYVVTATGGTPPYSFSLTGAIGGAGEQLVDLGNGTARYEAPDAGAGTGTATIQVTDSGGSPAATATIVVVAYPALNAPMRASSHSGSCTYPMVFPGQLVGGQSLCFGFNGGVAPFTLEAENPGYGEFEEEEVTATGRFNVFDTTTTSSVRIRAIDALGNATAWQTLNFYDPVAVSQTVAGRADPADSSKSLISASCATAGYLVFSASGGVPGGYTYSTVLGGSFGNATNNPNSTFSPGAATGTVVVLVEDSLDNSAAHVVTVTSGAISFSENVTYAAQAGNSFHVADGHAYQLERSGGVPPFRFFATGTTSYPDTATTTGGYSINSTTGQLTFTATDWTTPAAAPAADANIQVRDGCDIGTNFTVTSYDEPAFSSYPVYIKGGQSAVFNVSTSPQVGYGTKTCKLGTTSIAVSSNTCTYDTPLVSATLTREMRVEDSLGESSGATFYIRPMRRISSYQNRVAVGLNGKLCLRSTGGGGQITWTLVAGPGTVAALPDANGDNVADNSAAECGGAWNENAEGENGSVAVYTAPAFGSFAVVRVSDNNDPNDFADFAISVVSPNSTGDLNPDPDETDIEEDFTDIAETNTAVDGRFYSRGAAIDRFTDPGRHRVVTLGHSKSDLSDNASGEEVILMRYNADEQFANAYATLDTSFGNDGIARISTSAFGLGGNNRIEILNSASATHFSDSTDSDPKSIEQTGSLIVYKHPTQGVKYLVAGRHHNGSNWDGLLVQFDSAGGRDTNFGFNGVVTVNEGVNDDAFWAVAVQTDTSGVPLRILASGSSGANFLVTAHLLDGTLDTTWDGGDGKITLGGALTFAAATGISVAPGSTSAIFLGGHAVHVGSGGNYVTTAFRLTHNGTNYAHDTSWATSCDDNAIPGIGIYYVSAGSWDLGYSIHRSEFGGFYYLAGIRATAGSFYPYRIRIAAPDGCGVISSSGGPTTQTIITEPGLPYYVRHFGGSVRTPDNIVAVMTGRHSGEARRLNFLAVSDTGATVTESVETKADPIKLVYPGGIACLKCLTSASNSGWLFYLYAGQKDPDTDGGNQNNHYFQGSGKRSRF